MTLDGHQADDFKVQVSVTVFKCRDSKSGGGIAHETSNIRFRITLQIHRPRRPLSFIAILILRQPGQAALSSRPCQARLLQGQNTKPRRVSIALRLQGRLVETLPRAQVGQAPTAVGPLFGKYRCHQRATLALIQKPGQLRGSP